METERETAVTWCQLEGRAHWQLTEAQPVSVQITRNLPGKRTQQAFLKIAGKREACTVKEKFK